MEMSIPSTPLLGSVSGHSQKSLSSICERHLDQTEFLTNVSRDEIAVENSIIDGKSNLSLFTSLETIPSIPVESTSSALPPSQARRTYLRSKINLYLAQLAGISESTNVSFSDQKLYGSNENGNILNPHIFSDVDVSYRSLSPSDFEEVQQLHEELFPLKYEKTFYNMVCSGSCYSLAAFVHPKQLRHLYNKYRDSLSIGRLESTPLESFLQQQLRHLKDSHELKHDSFNFSKKDGNVKDQDSDVKHGRCQGNEWRLCEGCVASEFEEKDLLAGMVTVSQRDEHILPEDIQVVLGKYSAGDVSSYHSVDDSTMSDISFFPEAITLGSSGLGSGHSTEKWQTTVLQNQEFIKNDTSGDIGIKKDYKDHDVAHFHGKKHFQTSGYGTSSSTGTPIQRRLSEISVATSEHQADEFEKHHVGSEQNDNSSIVRDLAYILTLGVSEAFRHRGIAQELVRRMIQHYSFCERYQPCPSDSTEFDNASINEECLFTSGRISKKTSRDLSSKWRHPEACIPSESPIRAIYLHVVDYNLAAVKFYEKQRFQCLQHVQGFYRIHGQDHGAYLYAYYIDPKFRPFTSWGLNNIQEKLQRGFSEVCGAIKKVSASIENFWPLTS